MRQPELSIVISTKNRREDLARALRSCLAQEGPIEIVVIDDGSTDGTAELVRGLSASIRLFRFERSEGYIRRRNFGASVATAPVVLSLDDDAELTGSGIVEVARRGFTSARVGAVAIPYIDVRQDPGLVKQGLPAAAGPWVFASFVGTAHALRRELFLSLGGYRESLLHQGEESDYCLRMLDAGYLVAGVEAAPILHHESPRRDFERVDVYGRRNDVLFAWWNVPMPYLPIHTAGTVLNGLRFGLRQRRLRPMLRGLWRGFADAASCGVRRAPVRIETYRLHRQLKKSGPLPLAAVEQRLLARTEA